ncbi:MAG: GspE/PulE family protein, partial [Verrucomicrobiales bacterium]
MKDIFLEVAQETGCRDLPALEEVVAEAASAQRSVIDAIVDSKLVGEERYLEALSQRIGMPWCESLEDDAAKPHQLRKLCTAQLALRHRLLPVRFVKPGADSGEHEPGEENAQEQGPVPSPAGDARGAGILDLATYDPFNLHARHAASQSIEVPVRWVMASRTRVLDGIQGLYGVGADTFEQLLAGREMDAEDFNKDEVNIIDEDDAEASVVKFVNQIIREALEQRATDIHVEPLESHLRIRYRVDGILLEVPVPDQIKALQASVIARLKIMANLDIAERRLPQDGRINLQIEGAPIDVRVATVPTVEGESVSLRLLGQEKFTVELLGLEKKIRNQVDQLLAMSNGIVLITGPTGSGKSTTLYSFLSELNSPSTRIVTIEDPVENKLDGVIQIAVKPEINLTFATGLRSILRADPNIVMIGEIRDLETAEIAVRASLTGHLVFSTLHTNDSIGGITRLIDMGVEPFLVSASVRAFVAQRLLRRLCNHCKREVEIPAPELAELGYPTDGIGTETVFEPVGCRECRESGFHGRLAIYELCLVTPALQELITHKGTHAALQEQADRDGFVNLRQYGWMKVIAGITTVAEVISVTTT